MRVARFSGAVLAMVLLAAALAQGSPVIVAYWRFDESSGVTALDSSASGLDGTLKGSGVNLPDRISGKFGGALDFTSTYSEHVEIGADNAVTNLSGPKALSFWTRVRTNSSSSNGFVGIDDNTSSNRWYVDDDGNGGNIRMYQVGGGSSGEVLRVNGVLNYNSEQWQHILITDDGTGTGGARVYVDGQLAGTRNSFNYSGLSASSVLRLGVARHGGGYQYFRGDLDDFGVWSGTLTTSQATAVYSLGNHTVIGHDLGQVQQLFDIHEAGTGSGTVGNRQWTYATGLSTAPADLGRVVVMDGKYTVALDSSGNGVATQHGLIAYWRFDEGSGATAVDSSGSGLNGTLKGSGSNLPDRITGKFGGALDFNRENAEYVEIGSNNVVTQLSGATAFSFWTRLPTETTGSNGFISIGKDGDNRWYIDDINRAGGLRMYQVGGGVTAGSQWETSAAGLTYGQDVWHHVVVSDTGVGTGGTKVYVDGVLKYTANSFDYSGLPTDAVLRLGSRFVSSVESMGGDLDDVGIWNTALTQPQVKALYSLGNYGDIRYDLSQVQRLFDAHDAAMGGSVRYGSLQWDYATGLRATGANMGEVTKTGGRYVVALDSSGTGFVANAELIAHWKFDEVSGTTAFDSVGTNHGTLLGSGSNLPDRITGRFGGALNFNRSGAEYVEIGSDNVVTDLDGAKTFSFWTRLPEQASGSNGFVSIGLDTNNRWYIDDDNHKGRIRMWQVGGGATSDVQFQTDTGVLPYGEGVWHHVALADNGSGTAVYVDGQLQGTYGSFDYSGLPDNCVLRLGARFTSGVESMHGDLDDMGVWRVALTAPQIKTLYNAGQHEELGYDLGQVQQLFNVHGEGGGVRVDGRYWAYAAGLSTDAGALGQVVQDGQRFSISLAGDGTGVLAPGKLVAHWAFDDGTGTTATDSMGYVHGTLTGSGGSTGTWVAEGRVGGALSLDSSRNQFVMAGSDNLVTSLLGEKTIAFWVRMEEGSSTSNGFIGIDNGTADNRWYIDTTAADATHIRSYKVVDGAATELFRVDNALEFGEWRHVVLTDDGSGTGGTKVYVDGELKGTRNSFEFSDLPAGSILRLGAARFGGGFQYLEGDLDDFGIWSVALTAPQVLGLVEFALEPGLGYDLGQVQQLYDLHELGPGGGELSLDGVWHWQYADGLDFDLGVLNKDGGHYFIQLDAAGTGLMAVPEPGAFALLACALGALLLRRRNHRFAQ